VRSFSAAGDDDLTLRQPPAEKRQALAPYQQSL